MFHKMVQTSVYGRICRDVYSIISDASQCFVIRNNARWQAT